MKISELKQPYRRMAEYLAEKNTDESFYNKELLIWSFNWHKTHYKFWFEVYSHNHPEITEEIKSHFPADFDFSGEEKNPFKLTEISVTDLKPIDENLQKAIYTKLAKEGRFDELPETCEFSEPVEINVWDYEVNKETLKISGKFKGFYIFLDCEDPEVVICTYNYAQLPTPKIDFSEFKEGDVVEVEYKGFENIVGYIYCIDKTILEISNIKKHPGEQLKKEKIKSIKKLK